MTKCAIVIVLGILVVVASSTFVDGQYQHANLGQPGYSQYRQANLGQPGYSQYRQDNLGQPAYSQQHQDNLRQTGYSQYRTLGQPAYSQQHQDNLRQTGYSQYRQGNLGQGVNEQQYNGQVEGGREHELADYQTKG